MNPLLLSISKSTLPVAIGAALFCNSSTAAPHTSHVWQAKQEKSVLMVADSGKEYPSNPRYEQQPEIKRTDGTEVFRERYADGKIKIEREVALDSEGNYVNHGTWKMWDPAGLMIADGQYDMGKRVGNWTRVISRDSELMRQAPYNRFKAPFTSQVTFNNDKMNGEWLIFDADQRKCSQISIADGVRDGMAITWLPNGNVLRQAEYENGVPVGDVLQANATTGELERAASYLDGRRVASNTEYYPRSSRQKQTEELYLAPKTVQTAADEFWTSTFARYDQQGEPLRHGLSKGWHPNGQLQWEGSYEYGKRVGHFRYWHPNGQLSAEGKYANDQYHGRWLWWHENGQKAITGQYEDGRLTGEWRWWNEEGRLANRRHYDGTETYGVDESSVPEKVSEALESELLLTR